MENETSIGIFNKFEVENMTQLQNLPFVSVIIPNYNGEEVIEDCLSSVYATDYPNFEVILVDDASKDNSISIIRKAFSNTTIIQNNRNQGFVRAVNRGIKESKGEIVILLNMDTVVKKSWLSELVKVLMSNERIGIVGSKILDPDEKTVQHAGGIINSNGLSIHIGKGEIDVGQYDRLKEVDYVCGASMGFRKRLLEEIGYFDEDYSPLYYEDTDLAFRARKKGYKILYVPDSVLVHAETHSTGGLTARFYYLYHKSRIHFVIKIYGLKYFLTKFLKTEIRWLMKPQPKELSTQLIRAYFINLFYLLTLFLSKISKYNSFKRRVDN